VILVSAGLVLIAIILLIVGVVQAEPYLVMWSIVVSVLSAVFLLIAVLVRRHELFPRGGRDQAPEALAAVPHPPGPMAGAMASPMMAAPVAHQGAAVNPPPGLHPMAAGMASPGVARPGTGVPPDAIVLVIPGRKRYHVPGCRQLMGRSHEELTYEEAREEGFTPCTTCLPDAALGGVQTPPVPDEAVSPAETRPSHSAQGHAHAEPRPHPEPPPPVSGGQPDLDRTARREPAQAGHEPSSPGREQARQGQEPPQRDPAPSRHGQEASPSDPQRSGSPHADPSPARQEGRPDPSHERGSQPRPQAPDREGVSGRDAASPRDAGRGRDAASPHDTARGRSTPAARDAAASQADAAAAAREPAAPATSWFTPEDRPVPRPRPSTAQSRDRGPSSTAPGREREPSSAASRGDRGPETEKPSGGPSAKSPAASRGPSTEAAVRRARPAEEPEVRVERRDTPPDPLAEEPATAPTRFPKRPAAPTTSQKPPQKPEPIVQVKLADPDDAGSARPSPAAPATPAPRPPAERSEAKGRTAEPRAFAGHDASRPGPTGPDAGETRAAGEKAERDQGARRDAAEERRPEGTGGGERPSQAEKPKDDAGTRTPQASDAAPRG